MWAQKAPIVKLCIGSKYLFAQIFYRYTKIELFKILKEHLPLFNIVSIFSFDSLRSIKCFRELLYLNPNFSCSNEVYFRLGLMLKANGEYRTAFKYFQLALLDSAFSSFSDLQGMLFLKTFYLLIYYF